MWFYGFITLLVQMCSRKINEAITTHSYVLKHPGMKLVKFPRCKNSQGKKDQFLFEVFHLEPSGLTLYDRTEELGFLILMYCNVKV